MSLALAAPTMILGAVQSGIALKKMNDLSKQGVPKIVDASVMNPILENKSMLSQRAKFGMSPEEYSSARQNMASAGATSFRQASALGGGGGAIGRMMAYNQIRGAMDLASVDAQIKDRVQAQLGGVNSQISGLRQTQNTADYNLYQQKMQALGGALSSGLGNITGSLNQLATLQAMKDIYGTKNTGIQTPVTVDPVVQATQTSSFIPGTNVPKVIPAPNLTTPASSFLDPRYQFGGAPPLVRLPSISR